jgi:hypothetical protein
MSRFQPTQTKYYSDFNPFAFGDCALWLDAADSNTLTLSGSNVMQWNDKSGSNNHATQTSAANRPVYDSTNKALNFTAASSNFLNLPSNALPTGNNSYAYFIVCSIASLTACTLIAGGGFGTNNWTFIFRSDTSTGRLVQSWWNNEQFTPSNTYTVNQRFIAEAIYTSAVVRSTFVNGTQVATSTIFGTRVQPGSPNYIGVGSNASVDFMDGTISEIIVCGGLSTFQRQQLEGYLARKWGLRTSLPTTHPYLNIPPVIRQFYPLDIPGCNLWLDAADLSSFVFSSSNSITLWRDKSGLGMDASQTAIANEPFWSNNQVRINGSSNWLFSDATVPLATHALFIVHDPSNNAQFNNRVLSYQRVGTTDRIVFPFSLDANTPRGYFNGPGGLTGNTTLLRDFSIPGQLNLIEANVRSGSQVVYNGGVQTASCNVAIANNANSSNLSIGNGRPGLPAQVYIGGINEIITYARTLSDGERRQVESYLAKKWNLTYLLPGINSNLLAPTTVSGCALWLDAADSSTIDLSGSTVIRWRDKSGNGRDASGGVPPTYTSNAINGRNVVTFNGTNTFMFTNDVYSLREFHVFAVVQRLATIISNANAPTCIVSSQTYGSNNRNPHIGWITNNQLKIGFWNNDLTFSSFPNYTSPDPVYLLNCSFVTRSRRIIVNGASAAFDSNQSFIQSGITMVMGRFSNTFFNGNIAEYIVYTGSLLDRDRRQIEGYLATKWNIPGFENQHVFKFAPALNTPFNPNAISNCALWLDAADPSTLTLSGSNVSQWNDKSGNGRNATQTSAGNRPTYNSSNNTLSFTASSLNFLNLPTSTLPTGNGSYAYFVVCTIGTLVGNHLIAGGTFGTTNATFGLRSDNTGGGLRHYWWANDQTTSAGAYTVNQRFIAEATYTTGGVRATLANGTQLASDTPGTRNQGTSSNYIGRGSNSSIEFLDGTISEIIVYSLALTTNERQRIEGYLAWKWGLQNNLPTLHPYRKINPI